MDFHLDEDLQAVQGLAREVFTDKATTARVRQSETTPTRVDAALWADLAGTGLLGIALPEEHGGAGLGLAALAVLLEEQGRCVAPVPLWSAGIAALAVAMHGTDAQRAALLPGFIAGSQRATVALEEYDGADPAAPRCRATATTAATATTTATRNGNGDGDGDGWRLSGVKAVVPTPQGASHVLVSATTDDGPGLFLLAADAGGVTWELSEVTTHDLAGELVLDGAPAQALGAPGGPALGWTLRAAAVALAATQVGVAEGALALAATYLTGREQFGRPLGTFQALQHQLADCWIDIDAMRVTLWQAVTDLEDGSDAAARSALVAKWWCDQGGLDVVHRVQHVHGGIGVDVDYPVHRHFLWGKQISGTLGGAAAALADLGTVLKTSEVAS